MSEIPSTNSAVHHFQTQNEPIGPPPESKNGSTKTLVEPAEFDSMVAEISQYFDGIPVNDQKPKPAGDQPVNDQTAKPVGDQTSLQNGNQTPSTPSCNRNVTTSVLNKEGLPRNVCQNNLGKRSGGTLERLTRWERSDVSDVPFHIYMSLPRK